MAKKIVWCWEVLDQYTVRTKVFGGWLVSNQVEKKGNISNSLIFLADRDHEWLPIKPITEEKPPINSVAKDFNPNAS